MAEVLWTPLADAERRHWYCAGAYIGRPADPDAGSDAATISAAALEGTIDGPATLRGDVHLRHGARSLTATEVRLEDALSVARSRGAVRFGEPGFEAAGSDAVFRLDADQATLANAEFVLTDLELRGSATRVERSGDALRLVEPSLTRCPPQRGMWTVQAKSIRIDADAATASARHLRLKLGRAPVFYAPYLRFPVGAARSSGFLLPDLRHDDEDGLDIAAPYYLNIAPNADATLAVRSIDARGVGVEGELRHLGRGTGSTLGGAFLADDRAYDGRLSRTDLVALEPGADFVPADRWLMSARHVGRFGALRTLAEADAVSDNDYFVDLGSELAVSSRVSLERRAEAEFDLGAFTARLWAQGFQRLEPGSEPYRRLPEANVAYTGDLLGPLGWTLSAAWASFEPPSARQGAVRGSRLHVEPRLRLAWHRSWGFLALATGLRHTAYDLSGAGASADQRPERRIRLASLDGGLVFERDAAAGRIQTLEPRLYYLYQSHAEQAHLPRFDAARLTFSYRQLFRDNRFAGLDRIGDADRLAIGVASRLLDAATGAERLAARVGVVRHMDDPLVALGGQAAPQPASSIAGELDGSFGRLRAQSTFAWHADEGELEEAGIALGYRRDSRRLVNLGYRRRALIGIDQTEVSFHWPLARQWAGFGRWNHDWRHGQIIEAFGGVEYANCCLAVRALWHKTINAPRNRPTPLAGHDQGLLVQVLLRGLAGFGSKVDSRLERGIKGFRAEETQR